MTVCTVKLCHTTTVKVKKDPGLTFHTFPSNPVMASRWIKLIRLCRKEESWNPTKHTRICSRHFEDKYKFKTNKGLHKLRHDAVPTKELHISCTNENIFRSDDEDIESSIVAAHINKQQTICSTPQATALENNLEPILESHTEELLRKQLRKKTLLHMKHSKIIKSLRQKNGILTKRNHILKKKNNALKEILGQLRKMLNINNDVSNIISENPFAGDCTTNVEQESWGNSAT